MKRLFLIIALAAIVVPGAMRAEESNDPLVDDLWYLDTISAPEAWDTATGSKDVVVAVLDAGIDTNHPDLSSNLWKNTGEIAANGIDDDGNGYVDDLYGWDFVDDDSTTQPNLGPDVDDEAISHGSLISGILGAVGNNAEGIVGINWQVSIMSVRTLNSLGSGTSFNASEAVRYAVENGADVINLSFSGDTNDPNLEAAIKDAYDSGVVVVAALGNENQNTSLESTYPSCYGADGENWVIGVASVNMFDKKSVFSNYGDCADLSAPGEGIFGIRFHDPANGYDTRYGGDWAGTSMSAPMVSGAAALLLSEYPSLTPEEVSTVLKLSVDPLELSDAFQGEMGSGRLNVAKALEVGASFAEAEDSDASEEEPSGDEGEINVDDLVTTSTSSTVYYIPDATSRRSFINETAFFTHFDSFASVEDVQVEHISDFGLTGLMLPKAGVVLVKIQSDPRVYALEENSANRFAPLLREIQSEDIAIEMYGEGWAAFVVDIEPTFFSHFGTGDVITSPIEVDTSIMKTREQLSALAQQGN